MKASVVALFATVAVVMAQDVIPTALPSAPAPAEVMPEMELEDATTEVMPEVEEDSAELVPDVAEDSAEMVPDMEEDSAEMVPEVEDDSTEMVSEIEDDSAEIIPEEGETETEEDDCTAMVLETSTVLVTSTVMVTLESCETESAMPELADSTMDMMPPYPTTHMSHPSKPTDVGTVKPLPAPTTTPIVTVPVGGASRLSMAGTALGCVAAAAALLI